MAGMNCMFWNAQGMLRKRGELAMVIGEEEVDIACISETHLSSNVMDQQIGINGYVTIRKDRSTHMGGLVTYIYKRKC